MALGLLFMSAGKMTLGTTNKSVAALLCAFYPRYPVDILDNSGLAQALRHLWVLAVESRLLITKDVDTGEPCCLPIEISMMESYNDVTGLQNMDVAMIAPMMLPQIELIKEIRVNVPRYWSRIITKEALMNTSVRSKSGYVIWVKRKTGHLTYLQVIIGSYE
jgi:anaphase-promoting complex subunit 1